MSEDRTNVDDEIDGYNDETERAIDDGLAGNEDAQTFESVDEMLASWACRKTPSSLAGARTKAVMPDTKNPFMRHDFVKAIGRKLSEKADARLDEMNDLTDHDLMFAILREEHLARCYLKGAERDYDALCALTGNAFVGAPLPMLVLAYSMLFTELAVQTIAQEDETSITAVDAYEHSSVDGADLDTMLRDAAERAPHERKPAR